jgi:hypothetical protein
MSAAVAASFTVQSDAINVRTAGEMEGPLQPLHAFAAGVFWPMKR